MEEKSIILDLFNENVSFAERVQPKNTDYHSKAGMAERKLEELKRKLTSEQLKMLENFLEIQNSHDSIYNEETFRLGVSLGVRLTAEAFLLDEQEG